MTLSEKRISELADMIVQHIVYGRTIKALYVAQYLRERFGYHLRQLPRETASNVGTFIEHTNTARAFDIID